MNIGLAVGCRRTTRINIHKKRVMIAPRTNRTPELKHFSRFVLPIGSNDCYVASDVAVASSLFLSFFHSFFFGLRYYCCLKHNRPNSLVTLQVFFYFLSFSHSKLSHEIIVLCRMHGLCEIVIWSILANEQLTKCESSSRIEHEWLKVCANWAMKSISIIIIIIRSTSFWRSIWWISRWNRFHIVSYSYCIVLVLFIFSFCFRRWQMRAQRITIN